MQILDFYVDEPACLGVPPYLSPYIRYLAGAALDAGLSIDEIDYRTVDQWRLDRRLDPDRLLVVVAGSTVPGRYIGGEMGSLSELFDLLEDRRLSRAATLLGGPIRHAALKSLNELANAGATVVRGDIELALHALLTAGSIDNPEAKRVYGMLDRWAELGAGIVAKHPSFPAIMIELESYRGCNRLRHCSFCTEALYGAVEYRDSESIGREVAALYSAGMRHFRLGRQADILTYQPDTSRRSPSGFVAPNPASIERLYSTIRAAAPELRTLHLDNLNPGTIAAWPEESEAALESICRYNTPGDTAAMGLESADPVVIAANSLKCSPAEAMAAIEMVNRIGGAREGGVPKLLPGLNFIHGLSGESADTFKKNYLFLCEVLERGLLLRRINIRQVSLYENTALGRGRRSGEKPGRHTLLHKKFLYYRDRIRAEIDRPMLEQITPPGTILHELYIEKSAHGGGYLGRQLGSYPLTCKFAASDHAAALALAKRQAVTAMVCGNSERSLEAVTLPFFVQRADGLLWSRLPGIGRKRAAMLASRQGIADYAELSTLIEAEPIGGKECYDFSP